MLVDTFNFLKRFIFQNDAQFLMTRHYVSSQNTIISFEDIDFWPKIFLILYPSLKNSTIHIIITACTSPFAMRHFVV
jgi:hypothetical protein